MVPYPWEIIAIGSLTSEMALAFSWYYVCVPLSKTCHANTGSFVAHHRGRWVLLYSRVLKKNLTCDPSWLLIPGVSF